MSSARARHERPAVDDRGWALLALLASGTLFVALATEAGALQSAPPTTTGTPSSGAAAPSVAGTVADARSPTAVSGARGVTTGGDVR